MGNSRFQNRSNHSQRSVNSRQTRFSKKSGPKNRIIRRFPDSSRGREKGKPAPLPKFRLLLVWAVLVSGMVGLAWKTYQLQIVQAEELKEKARLQQTVNIRPYIPRRSIIDSEGNILATDRLEYILYVHPIQFKLPQAEVAAKLSSVLENRTPQELMERFKQRKTGIPVARRLTEGVAKEIEGLGLDGVEVNETYRRFYPQEKMMADVVGFVDHERQGQAGVELSQEKLLQRDLESLYVQRTALGAILPNSLPQDLLKSNDWRVQLTVDMRLQRAARAALQQQVKKFNAKRGAVIVMDATDGSIVSLVCEPTFDPNEFYESSIELLKNWTVSDLYEPGSTFKPINVALALEAGVIQPNTVIHDSGLVTVDGWPIKNASKMGNGSINIAEILQTSSNVAMVHMMRRLKKEDYYQRLQQLEINQKTGIDLPGEVAGRLKNKQVFTERSIEVATASFGQGFSLTPMKLVQLHGALANGGKLVTPHLVKGLVDVEGTLHWQPDYPNKPIISSEVSQTVVELMETVVDKGSGEPAKTEGYRIGGKTGTAQKAGPRGGYLPNAKITSFVSILPVESPKYVVLVVVDEPKGGNTYGSTVAAPVAKLVMDALISLKGIPPAK
ncbi:penicillin-binding protein [Crocosphaera subtropica ATCC 51142]|uniref:Penicillin-binding protein n=1 Tax=Crocosphaera subtropica (strain ATCC 51142 / BH68) TaxID=43989 RepID=B1WZ28_CROS5|nr:penicillin-binding protein 2 [Crocosphaera subtropica]ACB52792.1 penicillin-binding protein [Crocosphaera subtropica ATCC 51142]